MRYYADLYTRDYISGYADYNTLFVMKKTEIEVTDKQMRRIRQIMLVLSRLADLTDKEDFEIVVRIKKKRWLIF